MLQFLSETEGEYIVPEISEAVTVLEEIVSTGTSSSMVLERLPRTFLEEPIRHNDEPSYAEPAASSRRDAPMGSADSRSAAAAVWKMCLESIRTQVSPQSLRTWFEPLSAIDLEGAEVTLRAPSNFFYEWITEHFQAILEQSLKDVLGAAATFKFDSTTSIEALNTTLQPAAPSAEQPSNFGQPSGYPNQPGQQFGQQPSPYPAQPQQGPQQGMSGQSQIPSQGMSSGAMQGNPQGMQRGLQYQPNQGGQNSLQQRTQFGQQQAHEPNRQSAGNRSFGQPMGQAPSQGSHVAGGRKPIENNLNPRYTFDTFIRGESNKLAYAAAVAVANNPGGTSYNPLVIYGNVGLGKTHLIQAVGNLVLQKFSGARVLYTSSDRFTVEFVDAIQNDRINEFTSLYRSIDLLIIDDVQFFAGKEKTQDIFFHTFNALRELGKQIILTCDRPPKELKDIDDRLLNRLQWGLTTDIQAPDLETRIAILRHKAISDGIELSSEIIEFIATNVTTNIRELEGCLISLLATASLEGREPTLELARDVLRKVAKRSAPILSIETIQKTVAKRFDIDEELLRAKTRKQEVVQARQVAMYLAKELTSSSLKTIGLHFGGRDHSTVIHACQTVTDDMRHNPQLSQKVEELRRQFELMQ